MKKIITKGTICSILIFTFSLLFSFTVVDAKKIQNAREAQMAALKKVPSAKVMEVDTDMEKGTLVYEIELQKSNKEYTLQYRASDGKLLKYEWEIMYPSYTDQNKKNLSKKLIQKKAIEQVKNAKVISMKLTYDDGMAQYKVKLSKNNKMYKLIFNSKTGKLTEYQWELNITKPTSSSKYIGTEKAKSIALKKVPNATVIKVEFDKEDGLAVYEVAMVKGIYEYEVTIDAKSGKIIELEKDIND